MNKSATLIASMLALAPAAAFADMDYTGVDVSYVDVNLDSGFANVDGDAIQIAGSYALNERLFLLGSWQDQSFDFGIDGTALELGAGLRHSLGRNVDFVGTLSYVDTEVKAGNIKASDDGLALAGGVRAEINSSFEVDALLHFVDYDNAGSDTGLSLGGRWYFTDTLAISFGTDRNDNADTLRIGFRAEF